MDIEKKTQKFFYHYIPSIQLEGDMIVEELNSKKDFKIIGIIDSSGSMGQHWKLLARNWNNLVKEMGEDRFTTITFDNKLRHNAKSPYLNEMMYFHGGGGTCIDCGLKYVEEKIFPNIPFEIEIKIIFISDGMDNNAHTLYDRLNKLQGHSNRDVTFTSLGVLSEFPTFISMNLRNKYHSNPDEAVPSIFLIEYSSEKAWFNKFQQMKNYLRVKLIIPIEPPQVFFPW